MNQFLGFYIIINIILYGLSINRVEIFKNLTVPDNALYEQLFWLVGSNFGKKMYADFFIAVLFGVKKQMYYKLIFIIKNLYLWPIFSLNSIHYYLFINVLKKVFRISNRTHIFLLSFINLLHPSPSIFKTYLDRIKLYFNIRCKRIDQYWIYLCYGLMAAINLHTIFPFSYYLSFIFLLAYQVVKRKKRSEQFIHFLCIQLLISIYLDFNFSFIAFIFSVALIFIFQKIYFYLLLLFIFSFFSKFHYLDTVFKKLYSFFDILIHISNIDRTTSPLFLLITICLVLKTKRISFIIFFFILKSDFVFTPELIFSK